MDDSGAPSLVAGSMRILPESAWILVASRPPLTMSLLATSKMTPAMAAGVVSVRM